jgi:hypothetical protein
MNAPYEHAYKDDRGHLHFRAELPGFRCLGARLAAVAHRPPRRRKRDPGLSDDEIRHRVIRRLLVNLRAIRDFVPTLYEHLRADPVIAHFVDTDGATPDSRDVLCALRNDLRMPFAQYVGLLGFRSNSAMIRMADQAGGAAVFARPPGGMNHSDLAPGEVAVECYGANALTENQKFLFEWLSRSQGQLAHDISRAVLKNYCIELFEYQVNTGAVAGEVPYLPGIVTGRELDDLVQVTVIHLHPDKRQIGLILPAAWTPALPLGIAIKNDQIVGVGYMAFACVGLVDWDGYMID